MILLRPGKQQNGFPGKVSEINFDGSHSLVVVELLNSAAPLSINVKLQHTEQAPEVALGDIVTLSWHWDAANAFRPLPSPTSAKETQPHVTSAP
jgi:hypothetical protein